MLPQWENGALDKEKRGEGELSGEKIKKMEKEHIFITPQAFQFLYFNFPFTIMGTTPQSDSISQKKLNHPIAREHVLSIA